MSGALASIFLLLVILSFLGWFALFFWALYSLKLVYGLVQYASLELLDKLIEAAHGQLNLNEEGHELPVWLPLNARCLILGNGHLYLFEVINLDYYALLIRLLEYKKRFLVGMLHVLILLAPLDWFYNILGFIWFFISF